MLSIWLYADITLDYYIREIISSYWQYLKRITFFTWSFKDRQTASFDHNNAWYGSTPADIISSLTGFLQNMTSRLAHTTTVFFFQVRFILLSRQVFLYYIAHSSRSEVICMVNTCGGLGAEGFGCGWSVCGGASKPSVIPFILGSWGEMRAPVHSVEK